MPIFYLNKIERISIVVSDQLSITILLKNFFLPWKRHRTLVGYFVGIIVKILYLPIAILIYLTTILAYAIIVLIWLLLPPITIVFVLISLIIG